MRDIEGLVGIFVCKWTGDRDSSDADDEASSDEEEL